MMHTNPSPVQNLAQGTAMLTQAVEILQGTRWDASPEEARQYLVSMDMDVAFASALVADMNADNFAQAVQQLSNGLVATTSRKAIAIWVRKFGFNAALAHTGDVWEITIGHGHIGDVTCGTCKYWHDGVCDCPESQAYADVRMADAQACDGYVCRRSYMQRMGCIGVVALIAAVAVFLGAWVFTGNIWAAILLFEIIFDILMELGDLFG